MFFAKAAAGPVPVATAAPNPTVLMVDVVAVASAKTTVAPVISVHSGFFLAMVSVSRVESRKLRKYTWRGREGCGTKRNTKRVDGEEGALFFSVVFED